MRKLIYGFSVFLFLFVLSTAFYNSYQVSLLKAQVREMEEAAQEQEEVLRVNTTTVESGYYLKNVGGYVYVYRGDGKTLYEPTGIAVDSLPTKLRGEVRQGKHLTSELELYGFLENYSS